MLSIISRSYSHVSESILSALCTNSNFRFFAEKRRDAETTSFNRYLKTYPPPPHSNFGIQTAWLRAFISSSSIDGPRVKKSQIPVYPRRNQNPRLSLRQIDTITALVVCIHAGVMISYWQLYGLVSPLTSHHAENDHNTLRTNQTTSGLACEVARANICRCLRLILSNSRGHVH